MTVTVKLDAALEAQLRQRAAASGRSTSEVIRAALAAYLAQPEAAPAPSAHALGEDLFGRHRGAPDLATNRKRELARLWAEKQARP
jgi:plasmid stability protein